MSPPPEIFGRLPYSAHAPRLCVVVRSGAFITGCQCLLRCKKFNTICHCRKLVQNVPERRKKASVDAGATVNTNERHELEGEKDVGEKADPSELRVKL